MVDRRFNEVDLRIMLDAASRFYENREEGRFVVETTHDGRRWVVIVEPEISDEILIVVTAYPLAYLQERRSRWINVISKSPIDRAGPWRPISTFPDAAETIASASSREVLVTRGLDRGWPVHRHRDAVAITRHARRTEPDTGRTAPRSCRPRRGCPTCRRLIPIGQIRVRRR
jgi:hypothetical protein